MLSSGQILNQGRAILAPMMALHRFNYESGPSGKGSGGHFARGSFVRADRRLELHVRRALGLVEYHSGKLSLSHDQYMRALTHNHGAYPGYSSDPLDGFRHLLADLEKHGQVFLTGADGEFRQLHVRSKSSGRKSET